MPICSYLVYPKDGFKEAVERKLQILSECEVDRAVDRNLLLLVSETSDLRHQKEFEEDLQQIDEIESFAQTFGEIKPDEGEIPDDPKNHPT